MEGQGETVSFKILDGYGRATEGKQYFWYEDGEKGVGTECEDWYYGWYNSDGDTPYNNETINPGDGLWVKTLNTKWTLKTSGTGASQVWYDNSTTAKLAENTMVYLFDAAVTSQDDILTALRGNTKSSLADFTSVNSTVINGDNKMTAAGTLSRSRPLASCSSSALRASPCVAAAPNSVTVASYRFVATRSRSSRGGFLI